MISPPTNAAAAAAATEPTYTTIPISGSDVVSRSIQNLTASLSRSRPWPEFLSPGAASLDLPSSFSSAVLRLRSNFKYFSVNYAIVISACAAVALIGTPIALIVVAFVYALWLLLYFFREDPMVVMGYHVSDLSVIVCLVLGSAFTLWFTGALSNMSIGIAVGLLVSTVHGLLRSPQGLFLDEDDAASNGFILNAGVS